HHPQALRVPASTLKILTALVAFHYLGPEYRFPTELYLDPRRNLTLKGYGDPLLISETISDLVHQLRRGYPDIRQGISALYLDDSHFAQPIRIPGVGPSLNPYDAANGALCANFNTIAFTRDTKGNLISAESQTPLVPLARQQAVQSGIQRGRIPIDPRRHGTTLYCGQLFRHFLTQAGIVVAGEIQLTSLPHPPDRPIWRQASPYPLTEVVRRLMRYSNNFMANQLFLAAGAAFSDPPATLEKGVAAVQTYGRTVLGMENVQVVEGSGISRDNRLSAVQLLAMLQEFRPYHHLLRSAPGEYFKTGSLKGIRTRAGYLKDDTGRLFPYVILLNTPGKSTKSVLDLMRRRIERRAAP
ncbi:MAG: D-alanyl-D-alanine carboxypeptidase, partial [Desulfobacterales bacterium]